MSQITLLYFESACGHAVQPHIVMQNCYIKKAKKGQNVYEGKERLVSNL